MAQAVEQAQRQRELSKEALVADLDRLEARVRTELDVKTRIRRDGLRVLAVVGGAVVLVTGIVVLRARLGARRSSDPSQPTTLEDLTVELRELRKAVEKQGKGGSFAQKAALRLVGGAGAATGTFIARQMLMRQAADRREESKKPGGH